MNEVAFASKEHLFRLSKHELQRRSDLIGMLRRHAADVRKSIDVLQELAKDVETALKAYNGVVRLAEIFRSAVEAKYEHRLGKAGDWWDAMPESNAAGSWVNDWYELQLEFEDDENFLVDVEMPALDHAELLEKMPEAMEKTSV